MHKIYFEIPDEKNLNNIISFQNFKKQNLENLHTVGIK